MHFIINIDRWQAAVFGRVLSRLASRAADINLLLLGP